MLTMTVEKALDTVTFNEWEVNCICEALSDLMGVVICTNDLGCKPIMCPKAEDDCYGFDLDDEWKGHLRAIYKGFEKNRMVNVFVKEFEFIGSYLVIYVNGGSFDMPPLID